MAITTLDGLVAGMLPAKTMVKAAFTGEAAGQFHNPWYVAGMPGAASAPSPGTAGAALTSYAGQIPFPAAVGGENVHLARLEASQAANIGGVILCDRLWHNSGLSNTTTTGQTVSSATWPARDINGSTNGVGVMVGIEYSGATGSAAALTNITLTYTNDANVGSKTATISVPASPVAGTFVPFMLAAGDTGVRSIQTFTAPTAQTGATFHLVAYRVIASLPLTTANMLAAADGVSLGLPRMYDNSVPFVLYPLLGTAAGISTVNVTYSQG